MKSYEESFKELSDRVEIIGEPRPVVEAPPRHDDDPPGPSIFRLLIADVSLDELTLPGLFVGRSELKRISLRGSDLHFSCINWNDVIECDFSGADLSGSDLRATRFTKCDFSRADLSGTDLRGASFADCTFEGANMMGANLFRRSGLLGMIGLGGDQRRLPLSEAQRAVVVWFTDAPEPAGG